MLVKISGFQPGKLSWFHLSSVMNMEKKFREYISDNNNNKTYNLKQSKWNTITLKLNEYETYNIIKLKIKVSKTRIPDKTFGNEDTHELGVAVEKIWLT